MSKSDKNAYCGTAELVHDMRAPLTAINGFATAMLDGTVATEDFPRYLTFIKKESERLGAMVSRILSAEKISAHVVSPTVFNLTETLRFVLIGFEKAAEDKELTVRFKGEDVFVKADRALLTEALYNLAENAVKYSPPKSNVEVWVTETAGAVRVSFKNAAEELDEEQLSRVFDRYYRGNTDKAGTGLGLYIAKETVALHGGTLRAEKDGKNVIFSADIPNNNFL